MRLQLPCWARVSGEPGRGDRAVSAQPLVPGQLGSRPHRVPHRWLRGRLRLRVPLSACGWRGQRRPAHAGPAGASTAAVRPAPSSRSLARPPRPLTPAPAPASNNFDDVVTRVAGLVRTLLVVRNTGASTHFCTPRAPQTASEPGILTPSRPAARRRVRGRLPRPNYEPIARGGTSCAGRRRRHGHGQHLYGSRRKRWLGVR